MSTTAREHAPAVRLPGDGHMWVMVLGDLVLFGAYFVIFMVHRGMAPETFLAAQHHLNLTLGTVNTIVLLTSSWFMARAVRDTRAGAAARALRSVFAAAALGVVFALIKSYEWATGIAGGHTLTSGEFFGFYYVLTGVHLFHVGIGLIVLGVLARELRHREGPRSRLVEAGAIYWHMVDLLWIVLFALLHVMR